MESNDEYRNAGFSGVGIAVDSRHGQRSVGVFLFWDEQFRRKRMIDQPFGVSQRGGFRHPVATGFPKYDLGFSAEPVAVFA